MDGPWSEEICDNDDDGDAKTLSRVHQKGYDHKRTNGLFGDLVWD